MRVFLAVFLLAAALVVCSANTVSESDWRLYKDRFFKNYPTKAAESNARFYYAVNLDRIKTHNKRHANGLETYTLADNQYSDLRFVDFAALFPPTTEGTSYAVPYTPPPNVVNPPSFSYTRLGYISPVSKQEQTCNNGWAHAAATAIQIMSAINTSPPVTDALSPQNFVDCAGGSRGCTNQVSQAAFDYLTQFGAYTYDIRVYRLINYPFTADQRPGMCRTQNNGKGLRSYSSIPNGNDALLRTVLNLVAPVVIKFNPGTFEFMHYNTGIFTQPTPTQTAAHYMTVIGYGLDQVTNKQFWLVQNSFGSTWGEDGLIRIEMNSAKPITNSAIFPLSLP